MNISVVEFLDCPAYLDRQGVRRCGLPAEVRDRYPVRSTDGPLECARIQCPRGHWFNGPVESLTWDKQPEQADWSETRRRAAPGAGSGHRP